MRIMSATIVGDPATIVGDRIPTSGDRMQAWLNVFRVRKEPALERLDDLNPRVIVKACFPNKKHCIASQILIV